jgi:hypothetical protein
MGTTKETRKLRVKLYRDLPTGTVFRVLKERGRTVPGTLGKVPVAPPKGWFVKQRNTVATAYSRANEIILGLSDVVDVIAYPSEKRSLGTQVG